MNDIEAFLTIDFKLLIVDLFMILFATVTMVTVVVKFCDIIGKPIKWFKGRNNDHDLLLKTISNVESIQASVEESMGLIVESQNEIKKFYQNRKTDREQSHKIQKELLASISTIADANAVRDDQVKNLMVANKELLADRINQKYKHYISIQGIPEDEYDEFVAMHKAYNGIGGNNHGDAKFEYCMKNLKIIPVEIKLSTHH